MIFFDYFALRRAVNKLSQRVAAINPNQGKNTMSNDPISQIASISGFIDKEVSQINSLTSQLAKALAASTDTVSPDVATALQALQDKIAALSAPPAASASGTATANTPTAGSGAPAA